MAGINSPHAQATRPHPGILLGRHSVQATDPDDLAPARPLSPLGGILTLC